MDTLQIHNTYRLGINWRLVLYGNIQKARRVETLLRRRHHMLFTYMSLVLHNKIEPIVFTPDNFEIRHCCAFYVCELNAVAHLHQLFEVQMQYILQKFCLSYTRGRSRKGYEKSPRQLNERIFFVQEKNCAFQSTIESCNLRRRFYRKLVCLHWNGITTTAQTTSNNNNNNISKNGSCSINTNHIAQQQSAKQKNKQTI